MKAMNVDTLDVVYGDDNGWNGLDDSIKVNGLPFWKFMKDKLKKLTKLSKTEILMDHIVLVTRIFDHRVKSFFKHIVMKNDPENGEPAIKYNSYRIEFQGRGLPHVHAVLWMDPKWLEEQDLKIDLIEDIANDSNSDVAKKSEEKIVQLIDKMISCAIPKEDATGLEKLRREYVLAFQQHGHTGTCKKKGTICRFEFPRFPSERTMIAKPIEGTEKEKAEKLKKFTEILANAKAVLNGLADDILEDKVEMEMEEFYAKLGVKKEDYEEALASTTKGYVVILKRKVCERWTNNYHPQWILCWNANMDIQLGKC